MIAAYPFRACRNPFLPPPISRKLPMTGCSGNMKKMLKMNIPRLM